MARREAPFDGLHHDGRPPSRAYERYQRQIHSDTHLGVEPRADASYSSRS